MRRVFRGLIDEMRYAPAGGEPRIFSAGAGNAHGRRTCATCTPIDADSPEILSGLPYLVTELRSHWIVAVGVDADGEIHSFSNRCGVAKDFCIAVPAGFFTLPELSPTQLVDGLPDYSRLESVRGTSYAAPFLSGALAVLIDYFPGMSRAEIVARLLSTATKTGIWADDDIYGQGLLNLDAATRPVGGTRISLGESLGGSVMDSQSSRIRTSGAFSQALQAQLQGMQTAVFDEMDAPFFMPLSDFLSPAAAEPHLEDRLASLMSVQEKRRSPYGGRMQILYGFVEKDPLQSDGRRLRRAKSTSYRHDLGNALVFFEAGGHAGRYFGIARRFEDGAFGDEDALKNPYLGLAKGGTHLGGALRTKHGDVVLGLFTGKALPHIENDALRDDGETWREDALEKTHGALIEMNSPPLRPLGNMRLSTHAGFVWEGQGFIGGGLEGAFGEARGSSVFGGVGAAWDLPRRISLGVSAYYGRTEVVMKRHALFRDISPIQTSAFDLVVEKRGLFSSQDALRLRVARPLRVDSGKADIAYAEGRRADRTLEIENALLDLSSKSHALDLEALYEKNFMRGTLLFSLSYLQEPRESADIAGIIAFSQRF